ncbi:hypothetical protein GCM10020295_12680 [Streptomyces cinereospinus]
MGEGEVAAAPAGRGVGAQRLREQVLGAVEAVGVGVGAAEHHQQFDAPLGVGPAEPGGEPPVDEGAVAGLDDLLGVLAVGHGVEAAQDEQRALGVVAAGAGAGEPGEPLGAPRGRCLTGVDALPHVLHGPQPQPGGALLVPGGLRLDRADGLFQLVVVEQGLGEAEDGVDAGGAVETGHGERGPQLADGPGGRGEQGGAAQFVEQARVHVGRGGSRRARSRQRRAASRGADGEVLAGGLAQLLDEFPVVVRVDLEQVPGGGRGAASGVGDDLRGDAVHGGAQGVGDGVVDGGGDQRVDELQVAVAGPRTRRVGGGEDARRAQ